eukprot:jgi/Tetstr1/433421/TSEL_022695.t1
MRTLPGAVAGCDHSEPPAGQQWMQSSDAEGGDRLQTAASMLAVRTLELIDALEAKDRAASLRLAPPLARLSRDGAAVAPSEEHRSFFRETGRGYDGVATFAEGGDFALARRVAREVLDGLRCRYLTTPRWSRMFY